MSNRTDTVTVRLYREHIEALKSLLPEGTTASELLRNLVTLYVKGVIPRAWVFSAAAKHVPQAAQIPTQQVSVSSPEQKISA